MKKRILLNQVLIKRHAIRSLRKLRHEMKNQKFEFPSWMKNWMNQHPKKLPDKIKWSRSPCPHDQMSNCNLKKYPILRAFIHKTISHCWRERNCPSCWEASIQYFHKNVSNMEPSNFHPITLQLFLWKYISRLHVFVAVVCFVFVVVVGFLGGFL